MRDKVSGDGEQMLPRRLSAADAGVDGHVAVAVAVVAAAAAAAAVGVRVRLNAMANSD